MSEATRKALRIFAELVRPLVPESQRAEFSCRVAQLRRSGSQLALGHTECVGDSRPVCDVSRSRV